MPRHNEMSPVPPAHAAVAGVGIDGLDVTIPLLRRPNPIYEQDGAEGIHVHLRLASV
jgi:hypothetical protein